MVTTPSFLSIQPFFVIHTFRIFFPVFIHSLIHSFTHHSPLISDPIRHLACFRTDHTFTSRILQRFSPFILSNTLVQKKCGPSLPQSP